MNEQQKLILQHYKTFLKLDYFVLGIDIALLGWTIVNTDWVPKQDLYIWLMATFWILVILSIICGIIRQLYNAGAFGINYQYLNAAELASIIEVEVLKGGNFMNQQTGEIISSDEFKKYGVKHREVEKKGENVYKKLSKYSELFGGASIVLLILALFLLAGIKILSFSG